MDFEDQADEVTSVDTPDFFTSLKVNADVLVAKWYNKPGIPRNLVNCLIEDVTRFMDSGAVTILKNDVLTVLEESGADPSKISDVANKFDHLVSPFDHIRTEYRREKYFQSTGWFIEPVEYLIERRPERLNGDGPGLGMKPVTGQFFPLRDIFKKFFELPDALSESLKYLQELEKSGTDEIFSVTQCCKWQSIRQKLFKPDDIVLPMTAYCDEFEPNSALGPHSEKIGCIYIDLLCLPPGCQSKLENIFEALIYNAEELRQSGNVSPFDRGAEISRI